MKKIIFSNAHIVDPTQKINKLGNITVENKKITSISLSNPTQDSKIKKGNNQLCLLRTPVEMLLSLNPLKMMIYSFSNCLKMLLIIALGSFKMSTLIAFAGSSKGAANTMDQMVRKAIKINNAINSI